MKNHLKQLFLLHAHTTSPSGVTSKSPINVSSNLAVRLPMLWKQCWCHKCVLLYFKHYKKILVVICVITLLMFFKIIEIKANVTSSHREFWEMTAVGVDWSVFPQWHQHTLPEAVVSCSQTPAPGDIQQPTQYCRLRSGGSGWVSASRTWDLFVFSIPSWLCHFHFQEKKLSREWQFRTFARTL